MKSIESGLNGYESGHARMKELLGEAYNQEKIDAIIAGNLDFDKIMMEIEHIPSSKDPAERLKFINNWYQSHQEELEMFER